MNFKLNNVSSLSQARWAAAEGFAFIAFNFDKTDANYIKPMVVAEICNWVACPNLVASFENTELEVIKDIYKLLNIDYLEIDLSTAEKLLPYHNYPIILKLDETNYKEGLAFRRSNKNILAFSLQSKNIPLSDLPLDMCFLPSDFNSLNVKELPYGINIYPEKEIEPGIFDFEVLEHSKNQWLNLVEV